MSEEAKQFVIEYFEKDSTPVDIRELVTPLIQAGHAEESTAAMVLLYRLLDTDDELYTLDWTNDRRVKTKKYV